MLKPPVWKWVHWVATAEPIAMDVGLAETVVVSHGLVWNFNFLMQRLEPSPATVDMFHQATINLVLVLDWTEVKSSESFCLLSFCSQSLEELPCLPSGKSNIQKKLKPSRPNSTLVETNKFLSWCNVLVATSFFFGVCLFFFGLSKTIPCSKLFSVQIIKMINYKICSGNVLKKDLIDMSFVSWNVSRYPKIFSLCLLQPLTWKLLWY